MQGITVAYSGVHQAFQIALAAEQSGALDRFYCSLFDAPAKYGGWLAWLLGREIFASRRCDGIPSDKVREHPWPLLWHQVRGKLAPSKARDWLTANDRFDSWVSARLQRSPSRVFVGSETCAEKSFAVATERGMIRVLDCPQWHPASLNLILAEAARKAGLREPKPLDTPAMALRKEREFASADWLLVYSDAHRRSFERAGLPAKRFFQCPLWVDQQLWHPEPRTHPATKTLRVIFSGNLNLRKGVFFLLEAIRLCAPAAELTLAGAVGAEGREILRATDAPYRAVGVQSKAALRQLYAAHDVFVLPSLADSFGFVALEAMACGLPVIVTENCGVPVPDPAWRVPVMDSEAIARRLEYYAENRAALARDGLLAQHFARQFTPERYRDQIKNFFRQILGETPRPVLVEATKS